MAITVIRMAAIEVLFCCIVAADAHAQSYEQDRNALIESVSREVYGRAQEKGERVDVPRLLRLVLEFGARYPEDVDTVMSSAATLFDKADWLDFDDAMQLEFIAAMKDSPNMRLREFGVGRTELRALREKPLELTVTAIDGRRVDMTDLRGKVVLIDFWTTTCGACIDAMPHIRTVYDACHEQGFEVIGVVHDVIFGRDKSRALIGKIGMPWPQALFLERSETSALGRRLSIGYMFPRYFLLDKQGRLVLDDTASELSSGPRLEREVRRLLAH